MHPLRCFRRASIALAALLVASLGIVATPAHALKVMTYNLLAYPGNNFALRDTSFQRILLAIHPDVLVVQEINTPDTAGVNHFFRSVLDVVYPGEYTVGPF